MILSQFVTGVAARKHKPLLSATALCTPTANESNGNSPATYQSSIAAPSAANASHVAQQHDERCEKNTEFRCTFRSATHVRGANLIQVWHYFLLKCLRILYPFLLKTIVWDRRGGDAKPKCGTCSHAIIPRGARRRPGRLSIVLRHKLHSTEKHLVLQRVHLRKIESPWTPTPAIQSSSTLQPTPSLPSHRRNQQDTNKRIVLTTEQSHTSLP
jgi:hypothetical protein